MKGIIYNLLEEVVVDAHGYNTWEALLDATGLAGAYTSLGNYEDAEIEKLVSAAAALNIDRNGALRWFGRQAMAKLSLRYPVFFDPHVASKSFLGGLNDVVHAEVHKLYAGAACPHFDVREDGKFLLMSYRSPRRMCALAHGFIEGLADQYNEQVEVLHLECVDDGDRRCLLQSNWMHP